jgi:hypothetical protein
MQRRYTTVPDFNTGSYSGTQPIEYEDGAVELVPAATGYYFAVELGGCSTGGPMPAVQSTTNSTVELSATLAGVYSNAYRNESGATLSEAEQNQYRVEGAEMAQDNK